MIAPPTATEMNERAKLVAEHEDLELLCSVSSPEEHDQLEHAAGDEVES
jgi:hypothetical protein